MTPRAQTARRAAIPLRDAQRRGLLLAADLVLVALLTAVALYIGADRSDWNFEDGYLRAFFGWWVVLGGLWALLAWGNGLYARRHTDDTWAIAVGSAKVSVQLVVLWALAYFLLPPWTLVRHVLVVFAVGAAVMMPLWRRLTSGLLSAPTFRRRLLIVGAGRAGRTLLEAIRLEAPHDFDVAGFVDDNPELVGSSVEGVPVVADRRGLVETAERLGAREIALAITHSVHAELFEALMDAREQGLAVTPMPVLFESITGRVAVEHIGEHWAVALPLDTPEARGIYPLIRRALDVALALAGGLTLLICLPLIALSIRLDSPGPVFYGQMRVGRGGRHFRLFKLRTMRLDAEADGPEWAAVHDPRVTSAGRWLRRTRLDELPQVLNILRGEMSVIGPRPERPEFVERLARRIPFYRARHAVRPGITGWAAVNQDYAASAEDALVKLQYDLYYIKNQSPLLDANILLRTIAIVLGLRGR